MDCSRPRALPLKPATFVAYWSLKFGCGLIDPRIFGTLFERFLDPDKRAQIGAHYTDPDKIMKMIEPSFCSRCARNGDAKAKIERAWRGRRERGRRETKSAQKQWRPRREGGACAITSSNAAHCAILDPACGSGNFLYLALQGVKDLE